MQCIWSPVAKSSLWKSLSRESRSLGHGLSFRAPRSMSIHAQAWTVERSDAAVYLSARQDIPSYSTYPSLLTNPPTQFGSLKPAQISRAAAQAVRVSATSSIQNALYVVNSVHLANQLHNRQPAHELPDQESLPSSPPQPLPFRAIDFGRAVSPRLPAHSFLHTLIRNGQYYKAGRYAELMMEQGIRIRTTTMEKVVGSLCNSSLGSIIASRQTQFRNGFTSNPANSFTIQPEHFVHAGNRAAYRILMHARKFGQDRSKRMYETLINGCLMQGEILVGSLLFVLLVKEWQAHAARTKLASEKSNNADHADVGNDYSTDGFSLDVYMGEDREIDKYAYTPRVAKYRDRALATTPYPTIQLLKAITNSIETVFAQDPVQTGDETYLREPLQALAHLVMLVKGGSIHFGQLSPLFRAIYVCPKTSERIWVRNKRDYTEIDGYWYLHTFLYRTIDSLRSSKKSRTYPLDTRSCNALLYYALHHRLSPAMASIVLEHMFVRRELEPDVFTYNILLRAGTLLRRPDICDVALEVLAKDASSFGTIVKSFLQTRKLESQKWNDEELLRQMERNAAGSGPKVSKMRTRASIANTISLPKAARERARHVRGKLADKLKRLQEEPFVSPAPLKCPKQAPVVDIITLTSFLSHLIATGHPHLVADLVYVILPELDVLNRSSWEDLEGEARRATRARSRDECIQRAARLGPVFLATVLNALAKVGKTGLAERVWVLATEAQRASCIPGLCPGVAPWLLSIHAYTSMLQCYANEARKGMPRQPEEGSTSWLLSSGQPARGWARFVYARHEVPKVKRHAAGRQLGQLFIHSMLSGSWSVFQTMREVRGTAAELAEAGTKKRHAAQTNEQEYDRADRVLYRIKPPVPDARFFNVALKLFMTQPGQRARRQGYTRARARRLLRWTNHAYAKFGYMSPHWSSALQELVEAMVGAGYPLPSGLRHIFLGRWEPGTRWFEPAPSIDRSPYAYPGKPKSFRAHAIPVMKTRGLPIRYLPLTARNRRTEACRR